MIRPSIYATVRNLRRQTVALVVVGLLVGCGVASVRARQAKGDRTMPVPGELEAEFRTAVQSEGAAYRTARGAILARGAEALPFLQAQQSSRDWRIALTADILAGWLTNRAAYDRCTDAVVGNLPGTIPVSGTFMPQRRVAAATRLGKVVTPRLLEMLIKTHEYGEPEQTAAIFGSLAALEDERALPAILDLVEPRHELAIREWAASTLGEMKDRRAVPVLLPVLGNPSEPPMLRASAAMSLGTLQAKEAAPTLRALVVNEELELDLRKAAVSALGELRDVPAAAMMLEALRPTQDLAFQLVLISTVGEIGTPAQLPALAAIQKGHDQEPVREAAEEAAEKIKRRGGERED